MCSCCKYRHRVYVRSWNVFVLQVSTLCLCSFIECVRVAGLGSEDEVRLVEHLFDKQGYNALIRPVRNLNETVSVGFGLAMIQLINVVSSRLYVGRPFLSVLKDKFRSS